MCAWETDLQDPVPSPEGGEDARGNALHVCFVVWHETVHDYYSVTVWRCVSIDLLFPPCECGAGQSCQYQNGESTCAYECDADQIGGGDEPCETCGEGQAPNADGTACEACEHGESSTPGVCVDPREGVECPDNASCVGGACACDAGYKPILDMGDDPFEPEPELVCVDACAGVLCTGDNAHCSNGACKCDEGHHDPDGDGNCTKVCGPDEVDDVAKASLKAIPKEPWERSESYSCENNTVVVVEGNSSSSLYSHHDYPENSQPNPNRGSVCEVALAFRLAVATPIRTSSIQGTAWRCVGRK